MIDKILKFKNSKFGIKQIARELNLSKTTIKKAIKNCNAVKLKQENEYVLTADELFFERIKTALENKNTTIKQLQLEWAPDVNYFTFYTRYKNYRGCPKIHSRRFIASIVNPRYKNPIVVDFNFS